MHNNRTNLLYLLVGGISLGWMTGMTVDKVASSIITALLTAFITIVTTLSSVKKEGGNSIFSANVDSKPISTLVLGLVVGSILGIWTRAHNYLGGSDYLSKQEIEEIVSAYKGYIADTTIYSRLFEIDFSLSSNADKQEKNLGVLFSGKSADFCKEICRAGSNAERRIIIERRFPGLSNIDQYKQPYEQILTSLCDCKITL